MSEPLIYDAENLIMGRMATVVAKKLLEGKSVIIVNAEKTVLTGNRKYLIKQFKKRTQIKTKSNPKHGPFWPRTPHGILKRTIRGMLPWKKPRGKAAHKQLKVYSGVPYEYREVQRLSISDADAKRTYSPTTPLLRLALEIGFNPLTLTESV